MKGVRYIAPGVAGCLLVACYAITVSDYRHARAPASYVHEAVIDSASTPIFETTWVSGGETREAHSANIVMAGNEPVSVWYGGTEEGHADVALFYSRFTGSWSTPVAIANRASSERGLGRYIRKVGNPATHVWPDGAFGVFYVSVSVGGWGASAINYTESRDDGASWSTPVRLVTSPFLNISTLVRAQPLQLSDGSIELPIYHEFAGKFSESLHVARDLTVHDKRRISWGTDTLQPAIAPLGPDATVALLRYAGDGQGRVLTSNSDDAGRSWSVPAPIPIPNPNSAVAVLNMGDDHLIAALNDTEDGRYRLSLATKLRDGDWQIVKTIENEIDGPDEEFEFSYPSLTQDKSGLIHLVYTWNQKRIKHVRFNQAWLAGETG